MVEWKICDLLLKKRGKYVIKNSEMHGHKHTQNRVALKIL